MPVFKAFGVPVVLLSKVGDVILDLVDESNVQEESLVTKNPTENGINITDHVVNQPVVITLSGRFVDSPLAGFGGISSFFNPVQALASGIASGLGANRSVQMWHDLEKLRDRKERVDVVIQQRQYDNMVIKNLSAPRSPGDGGSLRFRIELHEIITTLALLTGAASALAAGYAHSGEGFQNQGVRSTTLVP